MRLKKSGIKIIKDNCFATCQRYSFTFAPMFRQLIAGLFILAFVMQTFNKPFILLDYYANTGAYAKNCVNKARPKMHCNGKCQVMKKMQEEEKKEQKENDRKADNKTEVFSSSHFYYTRNIAAGRIIKPAYTNMIAGKPVDIAYGFFHPPSAFVS